MYAIQAGMKQKKKNSDCVYDIDTKRALVIQFIRQYLVQYFPKQINSTNSVYRIIATKRP